MTLFLHIKRPFFMHFEFLMSIGPSSFCRIIFSFDPDDMKSMSNENLDKTRPSSSDPTHRQNHHHHHQRPISTEVFLQRRKLERERRFSAPPGERKPIRDSVGSIDYLSEGPGRLIRKDIIFTTRIHHNQN